MSQPTRDELMQRLGAALAEQESVVMALIWLELGGLYTSLEAAEDQVAAALRDACEALEEPQADLDRLDRAIADAEGRCVQWSEQLSDADPDTRADARNHYQEWSGEVDARRARRDEAERGYRELFAAREEQRTRLRVAQAAKRRVVVAQLNPFGDELAQATGAYQSLRMPQLLPVLLRHDTDSPEWPRAVEEFDELAVRSGLRTDHLPTEAERVARAMAAEMDAKLMSAVADPGPSGQGVMAQMEAEIVNKTLPQTGHVDDYRDPRTAVPRLAPVEEWRQVPRVKDML